MACRDDVLLRTSHLTARLHISIHPSPSRPRMPRSAIDAACVARIYEKLLEEPGLAACVKAYCETRGIPSTACTVLGICFPKPVTAVPTAEDFTDARGNSSKWLVLASAGEGRVVCHPGPLNRFVHNKLVYAPNEFPVFSSTDARTEMKPLAFTRRRRSMPKGGATKPRGLPTTVQEINDGKHRGCRDVMALARCLGELWAAKIQKRDVSIERALGDMLWDPFGWDDVAANRFFVFWRVGQNQFHCDPVTLRHLLKNVSGETQ